MHCSKTTLYINNQWTTFKLANVLYLCMEVFQSISHIVGCRHTYTHSHTYTHTHTHTPHTYHTHTHTLKHSHTHTLTCSPPPASHRDGSAVPARQKSDSAEPDDPESRKRGGTEGKGEGW